MKKTLEKRNYNEQRKKEEAKKREHEERNRKQSDMNDIWKSWKKTTDQRQREREREEAKQKRLEERQRLAYKEEVRAVGFLSKCQFACEYIRVLKLDVIQIIGGTQLAPVGCFRRRSGSRAYEHTSTGTIAACVRLCVQLSLTVDEWMQQVKRREERERRRALFMEQEENMFIRVRSPDECDRAFRQCALVYSKFTSCLRCGLTFIGVFNSRFSKAFLL